MLDLACIFTLTLSILCEKFQRKISLHENFIVSSVFKEKFLICRKLRRKLLYFQEKKIGFSGKIYDFWKSFLIFIKNFGYSGKFYCLESKNSHILFLWISKIKKILSNEKYLQSSFLSVSPFDVTDSAVKNSSKSIEPLLSLSKA